MSSAQDKLLNDLHSYLRECYTGKEILTFASEQSSPEADAELAEKIKIIDEQHRRAVNVKYSIIVIKPDAPAQPVKKKRKSNPISQMLEWIHQKRSRTFQERVDALMRQKNLLPQDIYKLSGMDRRQYSRIMKKNGAHPNLNTAICFCLGLRLNAAEAQELLSSASYALSYSKIFDSVILYCLENKIYEISDVEYLLQECRQKPLRQPLKDEQ